MVEGASLLLFCHDDVAPDPDAVHIMVEESFRSNAGVVAPQAGELGRPRAGCCTSGMAVDKGGAVVDRMEPGEIDHGQHDAVRDVFLAPGGCTLVRADLFAELGGFDPEIFAMGEDLDLCWRAQVLGARVVVAPGRGSGTSRCWRAVDVPFPSDSARRRVPKRCRSSWTPGAKASVPVTMRGAPIGDGGSAESDDGASRSEGAHDAATGAGVDGAAAAGDQGELGVAPAPVEPGRAQSPPPVTLQSLQRRHELHAALKAYGPFHLVRVLPQIALLALAEFVIARVAGHRERAAAVAQAWRWNLAHRRSLRAGGAAVRAHRRHRRRHGAAPAAARQRPAERLRAAGRDPRPAGRQSRQGRSRDAIDVPIGADAGDSDARRHGGLVGVAPVDTSDEGTADSSLGPATTDAVAGVAGGRAGRGVRDAAAVRIGLPDRRANSCLCRHGRRSCTASCRVAAHRRGNDRPHHPGHGDPRPGRHGAVRRAWACCKDRRARVHPRRARSAWPA